MKNKKVFFQHLGIQPYKNAWDYQETLFQKVIQQKINNRNLPLHQQTPTENYLLFCEHPHVYTLGKSGKETNLLINQQQLAEKQAEFFHINRGGDITYHGYGQIVGYPILDLDNFFTDIHKYLRYIEEAIINTLAHFHITAGRIDKLTGVWIDINSNNPRKICAIGVKTSRWVTMHGFAFNINTDLSYFNNIIPCGITDKAVTSLEQELGQKQDIKTVENILKNHLAEIFEMELIETPTH